MAADNLDTDLAICYVDSETKEIKATAYFEDYLYKIISSLGGEGSTVISDLVSTTIESSNVQYLTGLVNTLKRQIEEINNNIGDSFLSGIVKQIQIDTAGFIGKVKIINYTAENKDWVEARGSITVNLPADPLVNDQVIVSNGDGTVITVQGNGNNIKYTDTDTSINIRNQGTSLHFQLFEDESTKYWRIR